MENKNSNKRIKTDRKTDLAIISGIKKNPFIYIHNLPGHYNSLKRGNVFTEISKNINCSKYKISFLLLMYNFFKF